jgi:hypothetical protein
MTDHVLLNADGSLLFDVVGTDYVASVAPRARFMETVAEVAATVIADAGTGTLSLVTAGHTQPGDGGGARYVFAASAPSLGGIQSADGAWWVLRGSAVSPEMFGATGNGATDDSVAAQACFDFAEAERVAGRPVVVQLTGNYGLSNTLYVVATNLLTKGVSRRAGFKALTATGYVRVGDARNLSAIRKSPHCSFQDIGFDANRLAPFALMVDYDTQAIGLYNCTFEKATLACLLIAPNVTEHVVINCFWRLNGITSAGAVVRRCDGVLSYGNGAFTNCTLGGATAWGIRQMGVATNPYVDGDPLEENHVNMMGGRINTCFDGFLLNESHRVQHVSLSATPPAFVPGEVITGGTSGATGRFVMSVANTLFMVDLTDTAFTVGETVTGAESGLSGAVAANVIGTRNQGGTGTIRSNLVGVYLENPGNAPSSDGGSEPTKTGEDAIVARGRRSSVRVDGGTKHQIRGFANLLYADCDARITYHGPNSVDAQLLGGVARGRIASNGVGGDGTARVIVKAWPQRIMSVGNTVTTQEAQEDPASAWVGMIASGPHFEGPQSVGLGVIPPRLHLVAEVIDGTTTALPNIEDSLATLTTETIDGENYFVATRRTGTGASSFSFTWTPPKNLVHRYCMFVVRCRMRQTGAGFGGAGANQTPTPRARVRNLTTPANLWPADAVSTPGQEIPAPGAGALTGCFTMGCGFEPRSTEPLTLTVNISTRTADFDDAILVNWGRIYQIGVSAGL